jgi:hypothetical protein
MRQERSPGRVIDQRATKAGSSPVAADGVLYLTTMAHLYAVQAR